MKLRSLLALAAATIMAATVSAQEKPRREEFRLRATVQDVVMMAKFSGTVVPIGIDPRYCVTMRVESITPPLSSFTKGATVTFAIHSPSQLFGAAEAKGKTYDLTLSREVAGGKPKYTWLEVRR